MSHFPLGKNRKVTNPYLKAFKKPTLFWVTVTINHSLLLHSDKMRNCDYLIKEKWKPSPPHNCRMAGMVEQNGSIAFPLICCAKPSFIVTLEQSEASNVQPLPALILCQDCHSNENVCRNTQSRVVLTLEDRMQHLWRDTWVSMLKWTYESRKSGVFHLLHAEYCGCAVMVEWKGKMWGAV